MQALAIVCTMAVCLSPMTNQRQWQLHKSKHEAAKVISQALSLGTAGTHSNEHGEDVKEIRCIQRWRKGGKQPS